MTKLFALILKLLGPVATFIHVPVDKLAHIIIAFICVAFGWATGFAPAGVALAILFAYWKEWIYDTKPSWPDFWFTTGAALVFYLFSLAL